MTSTRHIRQDQRGQALVEFAIIAPLFMLIVAGVIQFGVGLNWWMDLNRISNQGARWAVVNRNPGSGTLQQYLRDQAISQGLDPTVTICIDGAFFPPNTNGIGDPVKVTLTYPFTFVPILGIGTITLRADTTMRLEQVPTNFSEDAGCP